MAEETGQEKSVDTDLAAAKQALEEQKRQAEASRKLYDRNQQLYEQQIAQLRAQLSSGQEPDYGQEEPRQQVPQRTNGEQDHYRDEQIGRLMYHDRFPNWRDHESEVESIISDPNRAQEVAAFDKQGRVDYGKSYINAHRLVELEQLRKAQALAQEHKEKETQDQNVQKAKATISGTTAAEQEETVDVDGMTSDEMIKAGLIDMDPRDPVKLRHTEKE